MQQEARSQRGELRDRSAGTSHRTIEARTHCEILSDPGHRDESRQECFALRRPTVDLVRNQQERALVIDEQPPQCVEPVANIDVSTSDTRVRRSDARHAER